MSPFDPSQPNHYPVAIWRAALTQSLEHLNARTQATHGLILDLGGGQAPLFNLINHRDYQYLVVDKDAQTLRRSPQAATKICASITHLPFPANWADIALSITCLQYVDQAAFFAEAHRVIKPGGILATHENGAHNPFIMLARAAQRAIGLVNQRQWAYRNSIRQYYRHAYQPPGFEVIYYRASGLFSALLHGLEIMGVHLPQGVYTRLEQLDNALLRACPVLRHLAFLHIKHFRRL
jgi:SAM-dependent methyltransferase